MGIKINIGVLLLVILSASIYILLPGQIRIDVQNTKTLYSVYEDGKLVLAAKEFVNLFDGTAKMRANFREVSQSVDSGMITISRIANYKDGIRIEEKYVFDSRISDVEQVPISHETVCINCVGKILQFEYRNILYTGPTKDITSPFSFGHRMKLTWQEGTYRSKVYQQLAVDKIILRYRPTEDYQVFNTRLFDPPNLGDAGINITIVFPVNNTAYVANFLDINWTINLTANLSGNYSVYSLDGGPNNTAIFFGNTPTNITLFFPTDLSEGSHNITIWANDSNGKLGQADYVNFSITPPLNVTLHESLADISYNVNWSKIVINFSNSTTVAGNFSWNFTDLNLTVSPEVPYIYQITNKRMNNVTVNLNIDRTADYFNWTYNDTLINTTSRGIFNLTPNESKSINFTLNLINISQLYELWNVTINRANWSFVPNFTDALLK